MSVNADIRKNENRKKYRMSQIITTKNGKIDFY